MKKEYSKDKLDRFYTKPEVVDYLLKEIDCSSFGLVIEPSAGNGSFSSKIPGCLAFDISPQSENIIEQDFLNYTYKDSIDRSRILCIGNPPFGRQGSLAMKFVNKCASIADTIAFILPLSFKKESVQKRIHESFFLIREVDIPQNSFLIKGQNYSVPCVFQVWKNFYTTRPKPTLTQPIGFEYVHHKNNPDFVVRRVGFYAGKASEDSDKSYQSHYFIKLTDSIDKLKLIKKINEHQWTHDNTVGPRSIPKNELNILINKIITDILKENNLVK